MDEVKELTREEQLEEFAHFVASEIIDEEYFESNHGSFSELACRKLVALGIMKEIEQEDGKYYQYEQDVDEVEIGVDEVPVVDSEE